MNLQHVIHRDRVDSALGAFIGLAVGDALGTTLEFSRRDEQAHISDMVGGGPFNLDPGQWTDDTAMALALADSLLARPRLDPGDLMGRFSKWYLQGTYSCTGQCFDIGHTTREAIGTYLRTGEPVAGPTDEKSAGNGSLMRLAPVALRFWHSLDTMLATATLQSQVTHGATAAIDACRAFGLMLSCAISGVPKAHVLNPRPPYRSAIESEPVAKVLAGSWHRRDRADIKSTGYVVDTLEAALWSVGTTSSFEHALLRAVNLGDDADTVGAVTGQLAGAIYGVSAIPDGWKEKLAWGARLYDTAWRLIEA